MILDGVLINYEKRASCVQPNYLPEGFGNWSDARSARENEEKEEHHREVCGRKISKEEYESYDGLCWECWDDQMTEEYEFEEDII